MADYLIFQLTAALGAMGELAGHERRGSLTWPGRSAVIGLLGAALGLRRNDDFSALERLNIAVATFDAGEALRDYHTVQTVPTAAAKRPQSRPAAMVEAGPQRLNTTITLRDYRAGPLYGIAVSGEGLADIEKALKEPKFTLYLGRKSCPLAAPPAPCVVVADSPQQALEMLRLPSWRAGAVAEVMASDGQPEGARHETRHDVAIDRTRWHFTARSVAVAAVNIRAGVAE